MVLEVSLCNLSIYLVSFEIDYDSSRLALEAIILGVVGIIKYDSIFPAHSLLQYEFAVVSQIALTE